MSNEEIAYRLIRIKARELVDAFGNSEGVLTNEQLGCYVRGVVDMQSELFDRKVDEKNNE